MADSVLCIKCGNWVHGKCAKIKRATARLAMYFVCLKCKGTANAVRWYGHVLRRDDDSVLRISLNLEVTGRRKRGRLKKTWKKQVEEEA